MSAISQGFIQTYGPQYDAPAENQGGGTQDQNDWKAKYENLNGQIASGQYVSKDSYVSLQQKLEAAVNERKSLQSNFDNATATKAVLEDNLNRLQGKVTELETTVSTKEQELGKLNGRLERHNVIFKDFPQLAPFEADGLIPDPREGQKLEDVLNAFNARLGSLQEAAKTNFKAGGTSEPPRAGDESNKSSNAFFQEALAYQKQGKTIEYNLAMDKYYAAKQAGK
jgi:hypothetical protein